jgi:hypothetical protein
LSAKVDGCAKAVGAFAIPFAASAVDEIGREVYRWRREYKLVANAACDGVLTPFRHHDRVSVNGKRHCRRKLVALKAELVLIMTIMRLHRLRIICVKLARLEALEYRDLRRVVVDPNNVADSHRGLVCVGTLKARAPHFDDGSRTIDPDLCQTSCSIVGSENCALLSKRNLDINSILVRRPFSSDALFA